jgi:hypothetical protein
VGQVVTLRPWDIGHDVVLSCDNAALRGGGTPAQLEPHLVRTVGGPHVMGYEQFTRNWSTPAVTSPGSGWPLPLLSLQVMCERVKTVWRPIT